MSDLLRGEGASRKTGDSGECCPPPSSRFGIGTTHNEKPMRRESYYGLGRSRPKVGMEKEAGNRREGRGGRVSPVSPRILQAATVT